jgi:hypothetical protein
LNFPCAKELPHETTALSYFSMLAVGAYAGCYLRLLFKPNTPWSRRFRGCVAGVSCKTFDVPDAIAVDADCGYVKRPSSTPNPKAQARRAGGHHYWGVCQYCLADGIAWFDPYIDGS